MPVANGQRAIDDAPPERLVESLIDAGLPDSFVAPMRYLAQRMPMRVLLIGSRASAERIDDLADFDALFVWKDHEFRQILKSFLAVLPTLPICLGEYIGPHVQFGHLVTFRARENATQSLDCGMMSEGYFGDFLPYTEHKLLYCSRPGDSLAFPINRKRLLIHTLNQCLKALTRHQFVFSADYLARSRTLLLLLANNPVDNAGMARSKCDHDTQEYLLTLLDESQLNADSLRRSLLATLSTVARVLPDERLAIQQLISRVRHGADRPT